MLNIQAALALTLFTSSSCALPIASVHPSSPSGVACLAVLITLFLGLLLLVFLKRVFIQKRRVDSAQTHQDSLLSLPASSTSAPASADSGFVQSEKAGFIVGFFGSPAVEIQCALEKAEWKENKQTSFAYETHAESQRRKFDCSPVFGITPPRNCSVSGSSHVVDQGPVPEEVRSFRPPSFPDKVRIVSSKPPSLRRFSLPTMSRSATHNSQCRRHSSLKSARSRRCDSFVPGSPCLRIVESPIDFDMAPPLSPQLLEGSMRSPVPSNISASGPFSPKFGARFSRSFLSPLPPLPFLSLPLTSGQTNQPAVPIQISHPYALAPNPRKNSQTTPPFQTDFKHPAHVRQPLTAPSTNFVSSDPPLSPTLSSFPSPPAVVSILKPKLKVRSRRSPALEPIGPSPLRTMILPESPECQPSSFGPSGLKNKENTELTGSTVSVHSPYALPGVSSRTSEVGIGSGMYAGAAKDTSNNSVLRAKRRHSNVSSRRVSKVEEDDPEVLLGIIRELVEEASEWDSDSVFMSQNFRAMLEESGIAPTTSVRGRSVGTQPDEPSGFVESKSGLSTRSVEVDLGLLGLDIFRRESFYDLRSYTADDSTNLPSFWDEDSAER